MKIGSLKAVKTQSQGEAMVHKGIILLLFSLSLAACSRSSKESSAVVVKLPQAQSFSKISTFDFSLFSYDNEYDDHQEDNWSPIPPTGFTGTQPFNCFAVSVTGPEPSLQTTKCGREDTNKQLNFDPSLPYSFYMGDLVGAAPAGATLQMEVPSGADRVFRLVGFHTDTTADCRNLKYEFDQTKMSKPYILATSSKMALAPGAEIVLPLEMSYNSDLWFDSCEGPVVDQNDGVQQVASQFKIFKAASPHEAVVDSKCEPYDIVAVDQFNRPRQLPQNLSVIDIQIMESQDSSAYSVVNTYDKYSDCTSGSSATNMFSVSGNHSNVIRRWIKTTGASTYDFKTAVSNANATDGTSLAFDNGPVTSFSNATNTDGGYIVIGPRAGLPGETYRYKIYARQNNGTAYGVAGTYSLTVASAFGASATTLQYSAGCTANATGSIESINGPFDEGYFCIRFDSLPGITQTVTVSNTGGSYTPSTPANYSFKIATLGGSTSPHHIKVTGPSHLVRPAPTGSLCHGPYYASLRNEFGSTVKNTSGAPIIFADPYLMDEATGSPSAGITIRTNAACSNSFSSNFQIANGENYVEFYVQVYDNTSSTTLGKKYLHVYQPGVLGMSDELKFEVDEYQP